MRSVSGAPLKRLRCLRAAGVNSTITVTVPARLAIDDPVTTTTGLPFRRRIFAGTVPEIETLPACVSPTRPDRYPEPISADAYLQERLREIRLK